MTEEKIDDFCANCGRDILIDPPKGAAEFCCKRCEMEYIGVVFI